MKLAALGALTVIAGFALGVDGLIYSGGLWFATGMVAWAILTRREAESRTDGEVSGGLGGAELSGAEPGRAGRSRPGHGTALGLVLMLVIGLGSLAIGFLEIGFTADDSALRWIPIALGMVVMGLTLITLPVRFGWGGVATAEARGETVTSARVTIEGSRETGTYINERPRIEFDLLVEPEGLPSYRTTKKATVPHTALGSISVGDGFEARVVPGKENEIEIAWDAPLEPAENEDPAERLERLEDLRRQGLITPEEYESQRQRILASI